MFIFCLGILHYVGLFYQCFFYKTMLLLGFDTLFEPIIIASSLVYIYSQVHKYWDIDTILTFLALYTTTMDFK